ncbi:seryl-tRNA synthetase [Musa troglodytarum]|uniref:serine--tRNA ligase n=1 Tax=Musa troglodytarum TaxID=320322 RepID=A0A9E7EC03_9LILI|nr:seryl-tRNA synthetase [Musa troglodytarum]
MLDINLFRAEKGFDPELVRESQRRRFASVEVVEEIIHLDREWRQRQFELDGLRRDANRLTKEVKNLKIARKDATEVISSTEETKKLIAAKELEVQEAKATLDSKLETIGNLIHDSVPVSNDEAENAVIRTWGEKRTEGKLKNHVDLVKLLDIVDLEKGADVAGGRGFYLKGAGVLLNLALINYGLAFLRSRNYQPMQTPFFMRKDIMAKCAQLAQFDEELYKAIVPEISDFCIHLGGVEAMAVVVADGGGEGDDKYLIATAEQPLCAYHLNDRIYPQDLPVRYAGYSTCFRKEAGSHGRDTLGIFRVHQFEKVEQFCITSPNGSDSWEMHEEMLKNSEDFYKELNIPYQVVAIVSGALNDAAAKKYDLEGWFPASKTYRELNDEQAKQYVHMLNSTLTATERTICCILENCQSEDGVEIPKVLQPYMGGIEFLGFKTEPEAKTKKSKAKCIARSLLLFVDSDFVRPCSWLVLEERLGPVGDVLSAQRNGRSPCSRRWPPPLLNRVSLERRVKRREDFFVLFRFLPPEMNLGPMLLFLNG